MKVLIADDDPIMRELLRRSVTKWGYDVVAAETGDEAWEKLRAEGAPSIAILDWEMPGINGIEICRRVKADPHRPFTYVVMLSGNATRDDMTTGLDAGADDYIAKPVDRKVLRARLRAGSRIVERIPPNEWSIPRLEGYDVIELIGKGGTGTVWKAVHLHRDEVVALKIIRRPLVSQTALARFEREIRITRGLDHPNIAKVFDSRFDETVCYYAMEHIDGPDLVKYGANYKPNMVESVRLLAQVADGVGYAHANGIVHRDLSPANILISSKGVPKVVDFGLAKSEMFDLEDDEITVTHENVVVGTPMYMAPEQAAGYVAGIDARSDVYALGTLLYMLLVRRHPHKLDRANTREVAKSIANSPVRPPSKFAPSFDPELERILLKALAREPAGRYRTGTEFADELHRFLELRGLTVGF